MSPEPFPVHLERGKIREFAAVMQTSNVAYEAPDAPIPPTFLVSSVAFWGPEGAFPDPGFDLRRLLHGEQEYIFHGPLPRAGDTLSAQGRVSDRYEKDGQRGGKMRFAVIVVEFRDGDGTLVAEQRTTVVETAEREASA